MVRGMWVVLLVLIGSFLLNATPATASPISVFDVDAENWTVGNFYSSTGNAAPLHVTPGGNPGGFIRTNDLFGWTAFHAPTAFLGDDSAYYGGSLSFDMRILSGDPGPWPMVVMSNGTMTLQFITPTPSFNVWQSFDIPLVGSAGWQIASGFGSGSIATVSQFQAVLSSVTLLSLDGDWSSGQDQVDLDNVGLNELVDAPEPSAALLLGAGLLMLLIGARSSTWQVRGGRAGVPTVRGRA